MTLRNKKIKGNVKNLNQLQRLNYNDQELRDMKSHDGHRGSSQHFSVPYLELREAASIAGVCLTPSLRAGREDSSWQLPLKEPGMLYNDSIYKSSQPSVCCFSKDTCSCFTHRKLVSAENLLQHHMCILKELASLFY